MAKLLTHMKVTVQVPRDVYFALLLEAERTEGSMGGILLEAAWPRIKHLSPTPTGDRCDPDEVVE